MWKKAGMAAAGFALGAVLAGPVRWWLVGAPLSEPAKQAAQAKESCACDDNSRCTGPRGGIYCITSGGNKRYF